MWKPKPTALPRIMLPAVLLLASFQLAAQTPLPPWARQRMQQLSKTYVPAGYLQPTYLVTDFSGDKAADVALLVERARDRKKGILILFANRNAYFVVGAGHKLGPAGDDFSWASEWALFTKKQTHRITTLSSGDVGGEQLVTLSRPAIKIRESEGSGGLIYFDGKQFVWIHQGD